MGDYLPVTELFRAVYLVNMSPSLGDIAKARFQRLGWKNVKVLCQDARLNQPPRSVLFFYFLHKQLGVINTLLIGEAYSLTLE